MSTRFRELRQMRESATTYGTRSSPATQRTGDRGGHHFEPPRVGRVGIVKPHHADISLARIGIRQTDDGKAPPLNLRAAILWLCQWRALIPICESTGVDDGRVARRALGRLVRPGLHLCADFKLLEEAADDARLVRCAKFAQSGYVGSSVRGDSLNDSIPHCLRPILPPFLPADKFVCKYVVARGDRPTPASGKAVHKLPTNGVRFDERICRAFSELHWRTESLPRGERAVDKG